MKKLSIFISLIFLSNIFFAEEIIVKPELQKVKVFLHSAEINQSAKVKIEKGLNEIVLTGIANNIDRNSINVSGKGDGVIISVLQRFDYLRPKEQNPEIKILQDSLEVMNKKLSINNNEEEVLKYELDFLMANKSIKNEKTGISIQELQKMSEFFKKKITDIKNQLLENSLTSKRITKKIENLKKQLDELNNQSNKPTNEIVVTISSNKAGNFSIDLSYLLYDAGWNPNYNIYVENIQSNAKLNYIANVWQNSGFDWKNVEIILSTRNPNKNNTKPELIPWYLNFYNPILSRELKSGMYKAVTMDASVQNVVEPQAQTMADYFEVNETQLALEFFPTMKYDIPSDNKPHSISLKDSELKSTYQYYAVPKFDSNAFLVMKLNQWSDLNLLPGEANIFFENSFVGKTYLNPQTNKDSLFISMGRDESIIVSRNQLKDFSEDKFLSSDIERTFSYEIKIKNNKKNAINLIVEEQFPISQQEDIQVNLKETNGALLDNEIGSLKWNVTINSNESISKRFSFSVRYPKDKKIQGL